MKALDQAHEWATRGQLVALATVVSVKRSAPRPPGTKMAVNDRGEIAGAVSGGCVEGAVVEVAEEILRGDESCLLEFGISDQEAWDVGLQCGGEIAVWVERYDPGDRRPQGAFTQLSRVGSRAALVTVVRGEEREARLLVAADGAQRGTLGDGALDELATAHAEELMWAERSELREAAGREVFVDVSAPQPRLFVFGAVDYAAALCALARFLGWRSFVVDPRARFAQPERFPEAERVVAAWPDEAFAQLGGIDPAAAIVVLTHDPKLDDAALRLALRSGAGYIGAMGSRHAQEARRQRLLAAGVDELDLARIWAPVGLDLGALTPAETAASIMAEVVAVRRGRAGGHLALGPARIHEAK